MRTVPDALRRHYEEKGWWTQESLGAILGKGLREHPDLEFRVHSVTHPYSGAFSDVELVARRLAGGLRARGVGPGDVIAFQLPNWMEAAATFWASSILGAVVVPIVHFYGPKELSFILAGAQPRVFITAERFGRMTYDPVISEHVEIVGVVGVDFDELLAPEPMTGLLDVDPRNPAVIAYTSGTTREPKGVIHTHQTLGFETRQLLANYESDRGRQLTALPVGHFIGMLGAFLVPLLEGTPVDMCDEWNPGRVLALIESHGVVIGGGPPYFVTSLLDHPDFTDNHLRHLGYIGLGGSAVPSAVTRRLSDLGIIVTRSYGSTEHPSITGSRNDAAEDKRLLTDGCPRLGVEIRLSGDGEILSRGPDLCLGYTDGALTADAFDDDGWYRTGDVGVIDEEGYLTITDRKSDIIIRGGENIGAAEVEDVLLEMPMIAEAVVVAAPDARFGEHAAAVVRLRPGRDLPTLDQVWKHFEAAGTARQKWPAELHIVEDYPRTASGKVQKHQVRAWLTSTAVGASTTSTHEGSAPDGR
ncbi:AMP-binding protein [Rhodococcus sp. NPDC019627]|uniref:AMP-binding protein n=1 Tax=unclassified Rhodococcus (in: high G+C Gram-positive bacteria) TaxID=192944 RepID=UPI0033D75630